MKKRYLSMLLAILMLLALTVYAFAEEADGEVSAAAADNTIDLVSLDNTAFNLVTYTVRLNITQDFADQGYCLGMEISNDSSFQQGQGRYFSTDLNPNLLYEIPASGTMQIQRHSICVVPNVTYYLRPVLYDNNRNAINRGNYLSFTLPADDSGYTVMPLYDGNQSSEYASERGWLHGKFTADKKGWYAITADSEYDFVSYVRTGCSAFSSVNNSGSGDPLILFFQANQDETVYVFGTPPNNTIGKSIRIVDAKDLAPTENSVEAGAPYDATNMDAFINFTISTTPETAAGGYQAGIVFGDPGTDPETWQGKIKIGRPEYEVKSDVTTPYRNTGAFVPGMDVDFQAALFTVDGMEILARGDEVRRLQTLDNFNNMTGLTKDIPYPWSTSNMPMVMFYYTAPADGMYAVQGTGMNILRLTDRRARDLGTGYLLGSYLREGETFFPIAYYTMGNSCSIEVKDGLTTFRQVQQSDGASQFLDETTPVWFQAPESGIYRFAIDQNSPVDLLMADKAGDWQQMGKEFEIPLEKNQILWLRRSSGTVSNLGLTVEKTGDYITSNLDLRDRETYQITRKTIVAEGVRLDFAGTELQIDPGVTLEIRGSAYGDSISNAGTLRISGDSASFRTNQRLAMTSTGHMEIDGHGYVELASNSIDNNAYLDPTMNMALLNGGSVTFGYFIPSEQDLRSLLPTLDNSNPNIRLDLQIYSGITLLDDLVLPDYVTLHTDYNWGQGAGFTIPEGVTLTIPQTGGFNAFSSAINIQGTLVNDGMITLGSVRNPELYPTISNMTLAEGGAYSGNGIIMVDTVDQPESYLTGFDAYKRVEQWRDEVHGSTGYRLITVQNLDTLTLNEDWTITRNMEVNADRLVVPAGITLTVNGQLNCGELVVNADAENESIGRVRIGYEGYIRLSQSMTLDGKMEFARNSTLNLALIAWNNSIPEHVEFDQNGAAMIEIHGGADSSEHFAEALEALQSVEIPSEENHWRYRRIFHVMFPWSPEDGYTLPCGVDFDIRNDGAQKQGSLTIPAGSTFTLDNGAVLTMSGADLTVNGTIRNYGSIDLITASGEPDGTIPHFTIGSNGTYKGTGVFRVRSGQADPLDYLVGFDTDKLEVASDREDGMGTWYRYIDRAAEFDEFKAACLSENHPEYYHLQELGDVTILENLTIPMGMEVYAWGTTLVIPDGVTLKVAGRLYCDELEIQELGRFETENGTDEYSANVNAGSVTGTGSIHIGDRSSLDIWVHEGNETIISRMSFGEGVIVRLHGTAVDDWSFRSITGMLENVVIPEQDGYAERFLYIEYPCTLGNGKQLLPGIIYYVNGYGEGREGSLTIPKGTSVTVPAGVSLSFQQANFYVNGALENQGTIALYPYENSKGNLIFGDTGSYSGGGTIPIYATDDLRSHIMGIDPGRVIAVWETPHNGEYRIGSGEANVLSDGDLLHLVTSEDVVFPEEYSANYLFTPAETGIYTFSISFPGDPAPAVHWDSNPRVTINGANIGWSFDTDEPESMVFRTTLQHGSGYEFVVAHDAALGSLNVDVSVSSVTGSLNDILGSLTGTGEAYNQREATVIGAGETVTVPEGVWLNLFAPLTVENGGTLINAGGISLEQGGTLTVSEGGMMELRDNPESGATARIQLSGGNINAADNTVTFGENSSVYLPSWIYNNDFNTGRAAAAGIPDDRIDIDMSVWNTDDVFGLNGAENLWENLVGYHSVVFRIDSGSSLRLTVDEVPDNYQVFIGYGVSAEIPENNTVDLNGVITINGGLINNYGVLNVNGKIETDFEYEDQNSNVIQNYGILNIRSGGSIDRRIRVLNNVMHYEECLVLPTGTRSIEEEAFAGTAAQEVDLPENIESIGSRAFADSGSLSLIVIQNGDAEISGDAFENSDNVRIAAPAPGAVETFATNAGIPFLPLQ